MDRQRTFAASFFRATRVAIRSRGPFLWRKRVPVNSSISSPRSSLATRFARHPLHGREQILKHRPFALQDFC